MENTNRVLVFGLADHALFYSPSQKIRYYDWILNSIDIISINLPCTDDRVISCLFDNMLAVSGGRNRRPDASVEKVVEYPEQANLLVDV